MIALDTNVLVRIFVDDDKAHEQIKIARQVAKKHEALFVSQTVQVELVWVLDFSYQFQKANIGCAFF